MWLKRACVKAAHPVIDDSDDEDVDAVDTCDYSHLEEDDEAVDEDALVARAIPRRRTRGSSLRQGRSQSQQSTWNLVVKYRTCNNKVYSRLGMIGYCYKNVAHLVDKLARNKNVSDKDITAGLDTYLLYGSSQLKGRIELTRFNLFGKADLFRRFRMQRKFASFRSTLKRMVCRYFNNQLATSSSDIVQMTYEDDSDVSDEEDLQEARRLDSRMSLPQDGRSFSAAQAEQMADGADEPTDYAPTVTHDPEGPDILLVDPATDIDTAPAVSSHTYEVTPGFGVHDPRLLASVTMATPVVNVTPPREQQYFIPQPSVAEQVIEILASEVA
ncbi:hypothetical protein CYMTET_45667 [Cymbomonas tetramitiformis]|uniref:Uncharacterized protein n=1 Tax=Cymbomonas tetramitiformis TaxID=36881 RepID=A0AAE0EYE0_9CHLO|nr:hypothetical protein CYMTET_45667 [Cymbomonas tetramitiformis]